MCAGLSPKKIRENINQNILNWKVFSVALCWADNREVCSGADILILITNLLLSFQHRKSGDQYKMQYIVSMFISILSFSHQSSAQNTFYCNLNFHDFYPPALLCAVCVVPEAARWRWREATCADHPASGGRRTVPSPQHSPQPAETSQPARYRAAAVGPPPRGGVVLWLPAPTCPTCRQ